MHYNFHYSTRSDGSAPKTERVLSQQSRQQLDSTSQLYYTVASITLAIMFLFSFSVRTAGAEEFQYILKAQGTQKTESVAVSFEAELTATGIETIVTQENSSKPLYLRDSSAQISQDCSQEGETLVCLPAHCEVDYSKGGGKGYDVIVSEEWGIIDTRIHNFDPNTKCLYSRLKICTESWWGSGSMYNGNHVVYGKCSLTKDWSQTQPKATFSVKEADGFVKLDEFAASSISSSVTVKDYYVSSITNVNPKDAVIQSGMFRDDPTKVTDNGSQFWAKTTYHQPATWSSVKTGIATIPTDGNAVPMKVDFITDVAPNNDTTYSVSVIVPPCSGTPCTSTTYEQDSQGRVNAGNFIGLLDANHDFYVSADPNIVAWYKFDESTGDVAIDSINGNNGTYSKPPTRIEGKVNGAIQLGEIIIPSNPKLNTDSIVISAWIKGRYGAFMRSNGYNIQIDPTVALDLIERDYYPLLFIDMGEYMYPRDPCLELLGSDWFFITVVLTKDSITCYVKDEVMPQIATLPHRSPVTLNNNTSSIRLGEGSTTWGSLSIDELQIRNKLAAPLSYPLTVNNTGSGRVVTYPSYVSKGFYNLCRNNDICAETQKDMFIRDTCSSMDECDKVSKIACSIEYYAGDIDTDPKCYRAARRVLHCSNESCTREYASESEIELNAIPDVGFVFSGWSGSCSGDSPTITVTVDSAKNCIANFTFPALPEITEACDSPTVKSVNSGDWNQGSTWNTGIPPSPDGKEKVLIQAGHTVIVPSSKIPLDSLCNQGIIMGRNGRDGYWVPPNSYNPATPSGGVWFVATNSILNKSTGRIKAGLAGNAITHDATHEKRILEAKGANSGSVAVTAKVVVNEAGGVIGPEKGISYSNGGLVTDGGNGGVGSNTYRVNHLGCGGTDPNLPNLGSGWNYGNAYGGKGGDTKVEGTLLLENKGTIASGYGGDARVWTCTYSATAGNFGDLTALSKNQLVLSGTVKGGKGKVLIEPEIMLSGSDMRIEDAKEVVIFGGDDWQLDLRNLSPGAITAEETIVLAVGKGGVIDLRGVNAQVMKAGVAVKIYADTVLLDDGVTLQNLIDAPSIETQPSKILYAVTLFGMEHLASDAGNSATVDLGITNAGPTTDTYTLSVSDEAGWELSGLPNTVTVDGLQTAELALNVMVPTTPKVPKNVIKVKATSQADPSVTTEMEITILVNGMDQSIKVEELSKYTAHGTLKDNSGNPLANVTVQVGDKTVTTDVAGNWKVEGLTEGDYTVKGALENFTCLSDVALGNEMYQQEVVCKQISSLKVSAKSTPFNAMYQGGKLSYLITATNGSDKTATGVVINNLNLPQGVEVLSLKALDGGECDVASVSCALLDLAPGSSARVQLELGKVAAGQFHHNIALNATGFPTDQVSTWKPVKPYLSTSVACTPNPVVMLSELHCTATAELSSFAPEPTATGVKLQFTPSKGTELKAATTTHGQCEIQDGKAICTINDLSIVDATQISKAAVELDLKLVDSGLLVLTSEAKLTAENYAEHSAKSRTNIMIPKDFKAGLVLAIDTTYSMNKFINGVIKGLEQFIENALKDPVTAPLTVLIEFKDDVRIVTPPTRDLNAVLTALRGLKVGGGGTCPEASVEAFNLGADYLTDNGVISIVTNAPPYPDANVDALKQRVTDMTGKGAKVFILYEPECEVTSETNQDLNGVGTDSLPTTP